jgi:acid phosphatase
LNARTACETYTDFVQVARRFMDGPNAVYTNGNLSFNAPNISVAFANDGQINQILAAIGVFDNEPQLPGNMSIPRKFHASRFVTMRGTVAFERLTCSAASSNSTYGYSQKPTGSNSYMRIRLNDVAYPVVGCTSGPGSSCPLSQYKSILDQKLAQAGDYKVMCNTTNPAFSPKPRASFFMDNTLPYGIVVKP